MRLLLIMLTLVTLMVVIPGVSASIYIFTEKDSVNLGDSIRVQVATDSAIHSSFEILVEGMGESVWLCRSDGGENITSACGKNEWIIEIPEDWPEGTYLVKVLINDVEPTEFFEEFKVIRPKIVDVELPELVYQGRTKVKIEVETANVTATSLTLRLRGNNVDYISIAGSDYNESGENLYTYNIEMNLREGYERTHDLSQAIQPGKYLLDIRLSYRNKVWDSRMIVVDISKPSLNVSVPEEITIGNPLVVRIHTNRIHDYGYDGIIVVFVGYNYLSAKKAILDDEGNAAVQFETAGMDEGKYTVYVRDTSLTSSLPLDVLAKEHYDLNTNDTYSKIIHAEDDLLIKKEVWLVSSDGRSAVNLRFSPSDCEVAVGTTTTMSIVLNTTPDKGIDAYEIVISLRGSENVAEIVDIKLPGWATLLEKTVLPRYAIVRAANFGENNASSTLAEVTLKTLNPGVTLLELTRAKVYDGDGVLLNVKTSDSYIKAVTTKSEAEEEVEKPNKPANASALLAKTQITATATATTPTTTTVTATTTTTAAPLPNLEMPSLGSIDYRKVVTFMIAFSVTYSAGKMLRKRKVAKAKAEK